MSEYSFIPPSSQSVIIIYMENKENLLGVVETVFKWKKVIIYTCLATAIGASIVALLLPVYYKSSTAFYAASPDLATPESIFGNSSKAPQYYGTTNDTERLMSIANSGELTSFMIDSFDLYERYDIDPASKLGPYTIRLKFGDHFDVVKTKYDAIELSMEDEEKEMAAKMANAARDYIAAVSQKLVKNSQSKLLTIFKLNIDEKEVQLDSLNGQLQSVRKEYGVYNPTAQSDGLTDLLAKAESKLYNTQARLEALTGVNSLRDTVRLMKASVKGYENELLKLNERIGVFNNGMAEVEMLASIQDIASQKLAEDREHFKLIKSSYESEFPTIILLETAPVPIIKSRPKRSLIVVASVMIAFVFSVIGIIIFDTYRDVNWKKVMDL